MDTIGTPQQMVMDFFDQGCISISNVTFTGDSTQIGYFQSPQTEVGLNAGLIMSTGNVLDASGWLNGTESTNFQRPGDDYFTSILNALTYDAVIL
ncbi:MAG: choice-of-anchor L domain-containing protein, partial [Bacteroidota bacterium]